MQLIMFVKSFRFFLELIKFYVSVLKITVLLVKISREMFYFIGFKSYPLLVISANEEKESNLIKK